MADAKPLVWLGGEVKTPPLSSEARNRSWGVAQKAPKWREAYASTLAADAADRQGVSRAPRKRPNQTWRIVYAIEPDAIAILEVLSKKTATTPKSVIATCKRRMTLYRSAGGQLLWMSRSGSA